MLLLPRRRPRRRPAETTDGPRAETAAGAGTAGLARRRPGPEDGVCTLLAYDVVRIVEHEFLVTYTLAGAYELLVVPVKSNATD